MDISYDIVIVGGGVFGLSTALSLAKGEYQDCPGKILVIDRDIDCPALDAAASDYNKICRNDYADPLYSKLALEALQQWGANPLYQPYFHQSGYLLTASQSGTDGAAHVMGQYQYCKQLYDSGKAASPPRIITTEDAYRAALKGHHLETGSMPPVAYINEVSGWAWSRGAIRAVAMECREIGVSFANGQVTSLIIEDRDVRGARTQEQREYRANKLVVLAAGSWSAAILPDLAADLTATGQVLAVIQLDPAEQRQYADTPVVSIEESGYYSFPPNSDGIFKCALHQRGYVNMEASYADPQQRVSVPLTYAADNPLTRNIPKRDVQTLRAELGRIWPALARKPFASTRMCWYSDTLDSHFLISYHKQYASLFLATGDSGHAFKFLPIIGEYNDAESTRRLTSKAGELCVQGIQHKLPSELAEAWSHTRVRVAEKRDRGETVLRDLDLGEAATAADLAAV